MRETLCPSLKFYSTLVHPLLIFHSLLIVCGLKGQSTGHRDLNSLFEGSATMNIEYDKFTLLNFEIEQV